MTTPPLPDGTRVRVKGAGPLPRQTCMPGVRAGTEGIVRHESPAGISNLPHYWLELEEPIVWSHGAQEPPYGFWCDNSQVEVVEPPGEPFIVQKVGVPDHRSTEQKAIDEAAAPLIDLALAKGRELIDQVLVDVPAPEPEPSPCTGVAHTHRWFHFGRLGEKKTVVIDVNADGSVVSTEQAIAHLLDGLGCTLADPDPVEVAAEKRIGWARSRLQDGLNAALNRRAR